MYCARHPSRAGVASLHIEEELGYSIGRLTQEMVQGNIRTKKERKKGLTVMITTMVGLC